MQTTIYAGGEIGMNENDLLIIKSVASILEYMAAGPQDVKYTGEALGVLSGLLMDVIDNVGRDEIE